MAMINIVLALKIEISDHWIGNVLKWSSLTGGDIRDLGFTICTTKNNF
jgi:hypothetical protein